MYHPVAPLKHKIQKKIASAIVSPAVLVATFHATIQNSKENSKHVAACSWPPRPTGLYTQNSKENSKSNGLSVVGGGWTGVRLLQNSKENSKTASLTRLADSASLTNKIQKKIAR